MTIHISNHELIDMGVGVTPEMKKDLKECVEQGGVLKEKCKTCSWKGVEMRFSKRKGLNTREVAIPLCYTNEAIKAVLGEEKNKCQMK